MADDDVLYSFTIHDHVHTGYQAQMQMTRAGSGFNWSVNYGRLRGLEWLPIDETDAPPELARIVEGILEVFPS